MSYGRRRVGVAMPINANHTCLMTSRRKDRAAGEQRRHSWKDQGGEVGWETRAEASAVAQVEPMGPEAWSLWAVLDLWKLGK